jgi:hypothetical protein
MSRNIPSRPKKAYDEQVISVRARLSNIETNTFFDASFNHPNESAIDLFFQQTSKLHTLINPTSFDDTLANLILLGYVSAVESYFRTVIRNIIIFDEYSMEKAAVKTLTYGAAIHYTSSMMPEALLEQVSFASNKNVIDCFKDYIGFKGHMANDVDTMLSEYENVCQLRHCIVHRFSLLGSNNALKLGMGLHSNLLEKPLKLDYAKLQEVFDVLDLTVRTCNNFLYLYLINRSVEHVPSQWTWDYRRDKKIFLKYYNIFSATRVTPSPPPYSMYKKLREVYK